MHFKVYAPLAFAALSFAAAISNPAMVERSEMAARQFPGAPFENSKASGIDSGKKVDEGIAPIVTDQGDDGSPKHNGNGNGNGNDNGNIYPGWVRARQFDPFTGSSASGINSGEKVDGGIGPVVTDQGDDGSPRGNDNANNNDNGNGNAVYPVYPPPHDGCEECSH